MKIDYKLTGAGWAECDIILNEKRYTFEAGYLTDALGEILQALLDINPLYIQECYIEDGTGSKWDAEPIETDWNFKYLGEDKMEMLICHYAEERWNPITDLSIQCSYDAFLKAWIDTSERILLEYGIVGYRDMWIEHEFPLSTFLKLKYYLEHHSEFPVRKKANDETTVIKSSIGMELNYINVNSK